MKHQVRVHRVPPQTPELTRTLRLAARLSLAEASALAIHLDRFRDTVLVAGVDAEVAEHLAEALRGAGAEVGVEPSSLDTPMLCRPDANERYEWGRLRTLRRVV